MKGLTFLTISILLAGMQCSGHSDYEKYADGVDIVVDSLALSVNNDSMKIQVKINIPYDVAKKANSIGFYFHYLTNEELVQNRENKIGSVLFLSNEREKSKQFLFRHIRKKDLYVKMVVTKKNKLIESPLLIIYKISGD